MEAPVRIGAVSYLNARPLTHGLERGLGGDRVRLSTATPAVLADRLAADELDVALLPVVELARMPDLELVPGLGIVTFGACRSVLLLSRGPVETIDSIALDPDSRTSNALARVLLADVWGRRPEVVAGGPDLAAGLDRADAAVRIGDKALFEPVPPGLHVRDLGEVWTEWSGLPFVFAAWAARPGVVDRDLYRVLHASRREGAREIERIALAFEWGGKSRPSVARDYLTRNIRFRLGAEELFAMGRFFDAAARLGVIDAAPVIRLAREGQTACQVG
jgi:chorismate dehydratase